MELYIRSLHTPSWRGAQLKAKGQLYFYLIQTTITRRKMQVHGRCPCIVEKHVPNKRRKDSQCLNNENMVPRTATPWGRVLLEKLTVTQLLKKFKESKGRVSAWHKKTRDSM
jgi:hypothetical protein